VDEGTVRDLYDLLKWGPHLGQQLPGAVCLGSQSGGQGPTGWACGGKEPAQNPRSAFES